MYRALRADDYAVPVNDLRNPLRTARANRDDDVGRRRAVTRAPLPMPEKSTGRGSSPPMPPRRSMVLRASRSSLLRTLRRGICRDENSLSTKRLSSRSLYSHSVQNAPIFGSCSSSARLARRTASISTSSRRRLGNFLQNQPTCSVFFPHGPSQAPSLGMG